jgi:hypothetical protein
MKISKKKISFFSSLNQYFPHIPYVASKKLLFRKKSAKFIKHSNFQFIKQNLKEHKNTFKMSSNLSILEIYSIFSSISIFKKIFGKKSRNIKIQNHLTADKPDILKKTLQS